MKNHQQQRSEEFLNCFNHWRGIINLPKFDSIADLVDEVNNYCKKLSYPPIPDIFALNSQEWSVISSDTLNRKHDTDFYGLTRLIAMSM